MESLDSSEEKTLARTPHAQHLPFHPLNDPSFRLSWWQLPSRFCFKLWTTPELFLERYWERSKLYQILTILSSITDFIPFPLSNKKKPPAADMNLIRDKNQVQRLVKMFSYPGGHWTYVIFPFLLQTFPVFFYQEKFAANQIETIQKHYIFTLPFV